MSATRRTFCRHGLLLIAGATAIAYCSRPVRRRAKAA
jgi:hypothetical protein